MPYGSVKLVVLAKLARNCQLTLHPLKQREWKPQRIPRLSRYSLPSN
jgi:hypothetical protein